MNAPTPLHIIPKAFTNCDRLPPALFYSFINRFKGNLSKSIAKAAQHAPRERYLLVLGLTVSWAHAKGA